MVCTQRDLLNTGAGDLKLKYSHVEQSQSPRGRWSAERARISDLTKREYDVFSLLGNGLDNHKISNVLNIGERTVKLHVTRILRKLQVDSRLQAGLVAAEHAFVEASRKSSSDRSASPLK